MKPLDLRFELLKKRITLADVARGNNTSRQLVRYAISGKGKWGKIIDVRKWIAKRLHIKVKDLWPVESNTRKAA